MSIIWTQTTLSNNLNARDGDPNYSYYQRIQESEVKTFKRMTDGKEVEWSNRIIYLVKYETV
jgi:hypothetical protein